MKIERMTKGSWGKVRAFFDLQTNDGFTIKGFRLIEGINGLFVSFPSQKANDGQYYDTVWADRDLKDTINKLALKQFGQDIMTEAPSFPSSEASEFVPEPEPVTSIAAEPFSDDDIPF